MSCGEHCARFWNARHRRRDNQLPIDSVSGISASGLAEDVLAATASRQRVALLEAMLARYFAKVEPVLDQQVANTIEMLRQRPASPVSGVASTVGLSERQLRRRLKPQSATAPSDLAGFSDSSDCWI